MTEGVKHTAGFTPGPWHVGPIDDTIVTAADRSEICMMDGNYNDPHLWPIMEANARLIAAAPDLLASVEELLWPLEQASAEMVAQGMALDEAGEAAFDRARAAIAKAKGGAL